MARRIGILAFTLGIILLARASQSDVPALPSPTEAPTEPITSSPARTAPGSESVVSRFQPYSIGPPEAAVPYEALTPAEQAIADKGRSIGNFASVNNAFAQASAERAATAAVEAAQHQLGVDNLATTGVVP